MTQGGEWLYGQLGIKPPPKKHRKKISKSVRAALLQRYPFCRLCWDTEELEIDHIRPVIRGGSNKPSNLTVLCRRCNNRKGAK